MGYDVRTNLSCSNPEVISSGSTFNQEWAKNLMEIDGGVFKYYSRGYYLHDNIAALSKQYPDETFTGITWNDSDIYDRIKYTLIYKNGECKQVNCEPGYVYGVYNDNYYEMPTDLFERFKKHLHRYIERIDIVREDIEEGVVFDFLNNKPDEDGFMSYYTIIWENDEHKFTATRRFTSQIAIKYEKKEPLPGRHLEKDKELVEASHDDLYDDLPF
jgi:hypothetical protein